MSTLPSYSAKFHQDCHVIKRATHADTVRHNLRGSLTTKTDEHDTDNVTSERELLCGKDTCRGYRERERKE